MPENTKKVFPNHIVKEHKLREHYVLNFFTNAIEELIRGFRKYKGREVLPERANLILCFTMVDIMHTYWQKYNNVTNPARTKPSRAFAEWMEAFCFTEDNNTYKKNLLLKGIDVENLYKFRNAIVHFYGTYSDENLSFSIAPNQCSDKWILDKGAKFSKGGKRCVIVRPDDICDLVRNGADLMLEEMMAMIEKDPQLHFDGIQRIYDEVRRRGAASIELNEKDII